MKEGALSAATAARDYGVPPELAWLPVDRLVVDPVCQRSMESRRSRRLVEAIGAGFAWARFGCVVAVKTPWAAGGKPDDGTWTLIDGQHRVAGARLAGVGHVPAVVLPHTDPAAAAQDFIAVNRDRVAMNAQAIHHALVRAGDPDAVVVDRVCRAASVTIARYPLAADRMPPRETQAVAAVRRVVQRHGAIVAADALRLLADAVAGTPGALRGPLIEACADIAADGAVSLRGLAAALGPGGGAGCLHDAGLRGEPTARARLVAELTARLKKLPPPRRSPPATCATTRTDPDACLVGPEAEWARRLNGRRFEDVKLKAGRR